MEQQDGRSFADVGDMETRTVGGDIPMGPRAGGLDGRIGLG
jgi:hypothetical protein